MSDFKKLTAVEVSSKRFTPVRMREGYSMDEVDEFLEIVEGTINAYSEDIAALERQLEEARNLPAPAEDPAKEARIKELEGQIATLGSQLQAAQQEKVALQQEKVSLEKALELVTQQLADAQQAADAAKQQAAAAKQDAEAARASAASAASAASQSSAMDIANASATVARMLETAARAHDDLVSEGQAQADALVAEANSEATRLVSEAQIEAARLLNEAQARAAQLVQEAEIAKNEAYASLTGQKKDLEDAVEMLKEIERNTRASLVTNYREALEKIESVPAISEEPPSTHQRPVRPATTDIPSFNL